MVPLMVVRCCVFHHQAVTQKLREKIPGIAAVSFRHILRSLTARTSPLGPPLTLHVAASRRRFNLCNLVGMQAAHNRDKDTDDGPHLWRPSALFFKGD